MAVIVVSYMQMRAETFFFGDVMLADCGGSHNNESGLEGFDGWKRAVGENGGEG